MTEASLRVSVILETYNWHETDTYGLWDALRSLQAQSWPQDRLEVVVVLDEAHHGSRDEISRRHPAVKFAMGEPGMRYFALKHLGTSVATGDIFAFLDCDVMPGPDWVAELVRPFVEQGETIGAVQGVTRFERRTLSRLLDTMWWPLGFLGEGPLEYAYTSNNQAFRADVYRRFPYRVEEFLSAWGLEKPQARAMRESGYQIWHNPKMRIEHTYTGTARQLWQLGRRRGYDFMTIRLRYPAGREEWLRRLGPLAPVACWPLLQVKDLVRLLRGAKREFDGRELLCLPLYMLAQLPFNLIVVLGMYGAIYRPMSVPPIDS